MKILIVEDVDFIANITKRILSAVGVESDIALKPSDAEKMIDATDYDAILMDFGLPEMTGLELTKVLREKGYSRPIVGLTANPDEYQVKDMKACGLNACLGKPLTTDDIKLLSMDPSLGWVDNGRGDNKGN